MNDAFTNQEVKGVDGDHIESEIGPRALGGRYRSAYSGHEYDVLAVARDDSLSCGWSITVKLMTDRGPSRMQRHGRLATRWYEKRLPTVPSSPMSTRSTPPSLDLAERG